MNVCVCVCVCVCVRACMRVCVYACEFNFTELQWATPLIHTYACTQAFHKRLTLCMDMMLYGHTNNIISRHTDTAHTHAHRCTYMHTLVKPHPHTCTCTYIPCIFYIYVHTHPDNSRSDDDILVLNERNETLMLQHLPNGLPGHSVWHEGDHLPHHAQETDLNARRNLHFGVLFIVDSNTWGRGGGREGEEGEGGGGGREREREGEGRGGERGEKGGEQDEDDGRKKGEREEHQEMYITARGLQTARCTNFNNVTSKFL